MRTNHGAEVPVTPEPPKVRSCNRHRDCDAADAARVAKGGPAYLPNFHCYDDDCEDCFGR